MTAETMTFGPLVVTFDDRVLRPRPWTLLQASWAAELAPDLPPGPILELCSGAGHIGQAAAVLTGRGVVQVDADPHACALAVVNAEANASAGRVEVRCGELGTAVRADERFPLVLLDPPYLPQRRSTTGPRTPPMRSTAAPTGWTCLAVAWLWPQRTSRSAVPFCCRRWARRRSTTWRRTSSGPASRWSRSGWRTTGARSRDSAGRPTSGRPATARRGRRHTRGSRPTTCSPRPCTNATGSGPNGITCTSSIPTSANGASWSAKVRPPAASGVRGPVHRTLLRRRSCRSPRLRRPARRGRAWRRGRQARRGARS